MPHTVYDLMDLYPQAGAGRPSVLYVPLRHGLGKSDESPGGSPSAKVSAVIGGASALAPHN